MTTDPTVLVIEDEETIRHFVTQALTDEHCRVVEEGSVREGIVAASTHAPDLLIVDLGLPDGDGMDVIRAVRAFSAAPIIVLSARTFENEKVAALDAGADDYLTKPFGMAELLARVRAQLRRRTKTANPENDSILRLGDVEIDLARGRVKKAGEDVHLTRIEMRLLTAMIEDKGKVLTHRQLLNKVWGAAYVERPHYLRIYVKRLRDRLEDDPAQPKWFLTEVGVGYRLAV